MKGSPLQKVEGLVAVLGRIAAARQTGVSGGVLVNRPVIAALESAGLRIQTLRKTADVMLESLQQLHRRIDARDSVGGGAILGGGAQVEVGVREELVATAKALLEAEVKLSEAYTERDAASAAYTQILENARTQVQVLELLRQEAGECVKECLGAADPPVMPTAGVLAQSADISRWCDAFAGYLNVYWFRAFCYAPADWREKSGMTGIDVTALLQSTGVSPQEVFDKALSAEALWANLSDFWNGEELAMLRKESRPLDFQAAWNYMRDHRTAIKRLLWARGRHAPHTQQLSYGPAPEIFGIVRHSVSGTPYPTFEEDPVPWAAVAAKEIFLYEASQLLRAEALYAVSRMVVALICTTPEQLKELCGNGEIADLAAALGFFAQSADIKTVGGYGAGAIWNSQILPLLRKVVFEKQLQLHYGPLALQ